MSDDSNMSQLGFKMVKELGVISEIIRITRNEIHSSSIDSLKEVQLPSAHDELDEVVKATEDATHKILEAAEKISDKLVVSGNFDLVEPEITSIFESCVFQDITGQRISKVIKTMKSVEDGVMRLINKIDRELMAIDDNFQPEKSDSDPSSKKEGSMLSSYFKEENKSQSKDDDDDIFFGSLGGDDKDEKAEEIIENKSSDNKAYNNESCSIGETEYEKSLMNGPSSASSGGIDQKNIDKLLNE